jgi:hypothetical protein
VSLQRVLAEQDPDVHRPHLAPCLHNLSVQLSKATRHREALAAAEEAAVLIRPYAESDPHSPHADLYRLILSRLRELVDEDKAIILDLAPQPPDDDTKP